MAGRTSEFADKFLGNANLDGLNGVPRLGGGGLGFWGGGSLVYGNPSNGIPAAQGLAAYHAPALERPVLHNTDFSLKWSPEEQAILEESLIKYPSEATIEKRLKIASELNGKTVRDVALRSRWMTITKKVTRPSSKQSVHLEPHSNVPTDDDDISYKEISGRTRQLLQSNNDALMKITANLDSLKLQENINLFCDTRHNILQILKELNEDMPETMKMMPPLPVEINEELANSILPRSSTPRQS